MTRLGFYGVLLVMAGAGIHLAFRSPPEPEPISRALASPAAKRRPSAPAPAQELANALTRINQIAANPSEPWVLRLRAMAPSEGISTAINQLSGDAIGDPESRLQIVGYLREHEDDDPTAINAFAQHELALDHVPKTDGWTQSYIENVAHLYMETSSDPERSIDSFLGIARGYADPSYRKALIGAYLQLYPEKTAELDQLTQAL